MRSRSLFLMCVASLALLACGDDGPVGPDPIPTGPDMSGDWVCSAGPFGDDAERTAECWPSGAPAVPTWEADPKYGGTEWSLRCPAMDIRYSSQEGVNPERARMCWPTLGGAGPATAVCSMRWPWMPTDGSGVYVEDRATGLCRSYPSGEVPDVCGDGHFNPQTEACDGIAGCLAGYRCASDCAGCVSAP